MSAAPAAPPPALDALDTIDAALSAVAASRLVLVVDDFDRENEGDFIGSARGASREGIARVVRNTTGIVCVALGARAAAALDLRAMCPENADPFGTAFTVTVDLRAGTTTGVSAADRAATIRALGAGAEAAEAAEAGAAGRGRPVARR